MELRINLMNREEMQKALQVLQSLLGNQQSTPVQQGIQSSGNQTSRELIAAVTNKPSKTQNPTQKNQETIVGHGLQPEQMKSSKTVEIIQTEKTPLEKVKAIISVAINKGLGATAKDILINAGLSKMSELNEENVERVIREYEQLQKKHNLIINN